MKNLRISDIESEFLQLSPQEFIKTYSSDERKGVLRLLHRAELKIKKQKELEALYKKMNAYEDKYHQLGYERICGIDEVGRGPLAGPVVAAAVLLPNKPIYGIKDSKKLSAKQREELYEIILKEAVDYSVAFIWQDRIDEINILEATKEAMTDAYYHLKKEPDLLLIDAISLYLPVDQVPIVSGDNLSNSIAAASILAKVTRDRWMEKIHDKYPQYGFNRNKGYGSQQHIEAIKNYGLTPIHRKTFTHSMVE